MEWNGARFEDFYGRNWELFKFKAAQYLRDYGSTVTKDFKKSVSDIVPLCQKKKPDRFLSDFQKRNRKSSLHKNIN